MQATDVKPQQTLYDLFALDGAGGVGKVRELAALRVGQIDADHASVLRRTLSEWKPQAFASELEKALQPNPFELLAMGWNQFKEVSKAVKLSKGPPRSTQEVALLKHELEVKLEPRLVLSVQGMDWCEVALGVSLVAKFEAVHLKFVNGSLTELALGQPTGALSLSVEHQVVSELKRSLDLKAAYEFKPPLRWPTGRAAPGPAR